MGTFGHLLVLLQSAWRVLTTFWWTLRTGRWGIVAVGVGILMWIYWKVRKGSVQDGANDA